MGRHAGSQAIDKLLVHIVVVVWNVERDYTFTLQLLSKLLLQPIEVPLLHDEDEVSPSEMASGDADARAFFRSHRANVMAVDSVEDRFGRETTKPILAADEQNLHKTGMGVAG